MGCVCSRMKKNKIGVAVKNEDKKKKKEKKNRKWWRRTMSLFQKSHYGVPSDDHPMNSTSSTSCSSSSEEHMSPTTAPTSPPMDIYHSGSPPAHSCSSAPLPGQTSISSSSYESFLSVPLVAPTSPHAADKDVGFMAKERLLVVQMQADTGVQKYSVRSERKAESGQGEDQGHAPNVHQLGFPNIGNTCYMNATLQCLLSLSCFWSPIKVQQPNWMDSSSCQMLRCFADLQQARLTSCSSKQKKQLLGALSACVSACSPVFGEDYEQDAHEFLMLCLLQLKEEGETLSASFFSYFCPVANFEFYIKSVRTCTSCGLQSSRVEVFNHLSVTLSSTLTDSLHTYFKTTVLDLFCECDQGCKASEVVEFFTLPRVLILHVKRFNMLGQKLTAVMNVPAELDLSALPGVSLLGQQSRTSGPAGAQDTLCEKLEDNLGENSSPELVVANESGEGQGERKQHKSPAECALTGTYRLHGVVSHLGGSMDSGHYISDVAEEQGESWLSVNDSIVSRTDESTILKRRARTAYLLFYLHSGAGEKNVAPWKMDQGEIAVSP